MRNPYRILQSLLLGTFSLIAATLAGVENFPRSNDHAQRSLATGVGVRSLPVLQRQATGTAEAKLELLTASGFTGSYGQVSRDKRDDRIRAVGDTWHLDVFGDGSAAEFFDETAPIRAHASGVAPSRTMSAADLEVAGRAYIERHLSRVIEFQPGDRLVPEARSVRFEAGVATDGSSATMQVVANRIVFTREINGIPVVGAGSKVTITFLNDGSVESFRYDWPRYAKTARTQRLVSPQEILRRVRQAVGGRSSAYYGSRTPSSTTSGVARIDLGGNRQLERLDCGYYDPGFMNRDVNAPVQGGCYYHVLHSQESNGFVTTAAYAGAVPAAKRPENDARWPEIALLRGRRPYGPPAPPTAGPATKVEPVPSRYP